MSPELFERFYSIVVKYTSEVDRERLADKLICKRTHGDMVRERCQLIRAYRKNWYADLSAHAAGRAIERDIERLAAAGFLHRSAPAISDKKWADAFELLRCGPMLSATTMRKLLDPGPTSRSR